MVFTVREMHNTVWDMNDPNCIVLGPTAPLEYLVLQRVLVSYTESVSCILLDVNLNTEIVLYPFETHPLPVRLTLNCLCLVPPA